jgi:hypothetical protein
MCSADDRCRARLFRRTPERPQERKSVGGLVGSHAIVLLSIPDVSVAWLFLICPQFFGLARSTTDGHTHCWYQDVLSCGQKIILLSSLFPQDSPRAAAIAIATASAPPYPAVCNESRPRRFRTAPNSFVSLTNNKPCQAPNLILPQHSAQQVIVRLNQIARR